MKPLKIILLSVVLLALALVGISYQLPLQLEVERSIVLDAKPEQVYSLLENPTEWEKWSALNKTMDPSMIRMYSGPMAGVGARMQWSGDVVGTGEVIFTQSNKPTKLVYKQNDSEYMATAEGSFTLAPTDSGTLVLWKQFAPVEDAPVARLVAVWQKYKKQDELDKGLLRLRSLLQTRTNGSAASKRVAQSERDE